MSITEKIEALDKIIAVAARDKAAREAAAEDEALLDAALAQTEYADLVDPFRNELF